MYLTQKIGLFCFEYNGLILSEKFIVVSYSLTQTENRASQSGFKTFKPKQK